MGLCRSDIEQFAVKGLHWNTQIVFGLVIYIYICQWVSFVFPIISHLYIICFNFLFVCLCPLFFFFNLLLSHTTRFLPLFCSWLPSANLLFTAICHICYYSWKKKERKKDRAGCFCKHIGNIICNKMKFPKCVKDIKADKVTVCQVICHLYLTYFILWNRRSRNLNAVRCWIGIEMRKTQNPLEFEHLLRNIVRLDLHPVKIQCIACVCCGGAAPTLALLCCSTCCHTHWKDRKVCTIDSSHWIGNANFSTLSLHLVMIYTF